MKSLPLALPISVIRHPRRWLAWMRRRISIDGADVHRWSDLGNFDPAWDGRTRQIAEMLGDAKSILEFGAGRQQLRLMLGKSVRYRPSDIVSRGDDTLVWDLNDGAPDLACNYDAAVFSGVLEYVGDMGTVLRGLRPSIGRIIASYASIEEVPDRLTRLENGWINHLSPSAFEQVFESAGYTLYSRRAWVDSSIYEFRSNAEA